MTGLAARSLVELRGRIKALRNELVMAGSPLSWIVVQKVDQNMDLVTLSDSELFRRASAKDYISSDSVSRAEANDRFDTHRLSKAHHGVIKVFHYVLVGASVEQLVAVNRLALRVPYSHWYEFVDFRDQLGSDMLITVHMNVLQHVVDRDMSSV